VQNYFAQQCLFARRHIEYAEMEADGTGADGSR
jgi:hypothetical protein